MNTDTIAKEELRRFENLKRTVETALSHQGVTVNSPLIKHFCLKYSIPVEVLVAKSCKHCSQDPCPNCKNTGLERWITAELGAICSCPNSSKIKTVGPKMSNEV